MAGNSFITLLLFLCVPFASLAQTFSNDEYGYTIEIDDSYQLTRNDHVTYFRSKDNDSVIIMKNWPGLDVDAARDYLLQGYQDEHMAIVSVSEPEEINLDKGKAVLVEVEGVIERKLMKGIAGGFVGDNGQGVVVLVSASGENRDKLAAAAQQAARSVKFIDFKAGPDVHDWYYMLSGTRLSLRGTSKDRSQREDIYFCADGSFRHRMSSSTMKELDSGSTFGFSGKTRSGSWKVVDDDGNSRLMMRYSNGREKSAIIEDRSGQTFLDDQRFYMMKNNRCR